MYSQAFWLAAAACLTLRAFAASQEQFSELLTLKPLRDGRVATHFSFTISKGALQSKNENAHTALHNSLFPLALGQLLRQYGVNELHLTLNAGKWNYGQWGFPDDPAVASGAELWAWMSDTQDSSVDETWKGLKNALSGLFCASIGQLDELRTTSPKHAFYPEGHLPNNSMLGLRHASLPAEHVCTENLTPFLKLLPCKSAAGIASLLNPHRVFDADWHGMGIHVTKTNRGDMHLKLSVQAVFDPIRLFNGKRDFSFGALFDRRISKACPVASSSYIDVSLPLSAPYAIVPEPHSIQEQVARYDVETAKIQPLELSLSFPGDTFSYPLGPPQTPLTDIEVFRTLTGSSQTRGRLNVRVRNMRMSDQSVLYVETMPWLVSLHLHTMVLTVDGKDRGDLLSSMSYTPAEPHGHPTLLEAKLLVPANQTLQISMEVTKAFLRYTEHPPDPHRGWDLPPATFFFSNRMNHSFTDTSRRVYSPALLVDVATPDFSMPYNVIIMSSTLIAFIFATIFNLFTRNLIYVRVDDDNGTAQALPPGAEPPVPNPAD